MMTSISFEGCWPSGRMEGGEKEVSTAVAVHFEFCAHVRVGRSI